VHKDSWKEAYKLKCEALKAKDGSTSMFDIFKKKATQKAKDYFGWIEQVVECNFPFEYVNNKIIQKHSNLSEVNSKSIKKYMFKLQDYVKAKVKAALPLRFGLIFDGWSNGTSEHVVAIFATCGTSTGCFQVLLGINELDDHTNQNSENHIAYITKVLREYDRDPSCIDFMVGDNTNLNPCIARNLNGSTSTPFIGCYSHKLNLAVKAFQEDIQHIVDKVEDVMVTMRSNNNFGILKTYCEQNNVKLLRPVLKNATRWSSTFVMLERYLNLHPHLFHICTHECFRRANLSSKLLTPLEFEQLSEYIPMFGELNDITKALQHSTLTLSQARTYFDLIYSKYGRIHDCFKVYCKNYVTSNFENAVIKVMRNEPLNVAETRSLRHFEKPSESNNVAESGNVQSNPIENMSIMEAAEREFKRQRLDAESPKIDYVPLHHVSPTSNVVERLFSQAKLVYSDARKSLKFDTFEMILYLKTNRHFWDIHAIDQIIAAQKTEPSIEDFFNEDDDETVSTAELVTRNLIRPDEYEMFD